MSTLLIHVAGNRLYNLTLFRPHLYLYDDKIVYKKRHLMTHEEVTVGYNHIAQVDLQKYIVKFAHIDILSTGHQYIRIRWIDKKSAVKMKKIIDEKMYQSHKHLMGEKEGSLVIKDFELSMKRLAELKNNGKISEHEYEKRKKNLLKKHY